MIRAMQCLALAFLGGALLFAGCIFGPSRFQGALGYSHDKVWLRYATPYQKGNFYRVGPLPGGWERLRTNARAIAFYHPAYRATIYTDAFCGGSFSDAPDEVLIGGMVGGLQELKTLHQEPLMLDGRGALRRRMHAALDGVPLELDAMVVKKDDCLFDFLAVAPFPADPAVRADFVAFYEGFHFGGGPF